MVLSSHARSPFRRVLPAATAALVIFRHRQIFVDPFFFSSSFFFSSQGRCSRSTKTLKELPLYFCALSAQHCSPITVWLTIDGEGRWGEKLPAGAAADVEILASFFFIWHIRLSCQNIVLGRKNHNVCYRWQFTQRCRCVILTAPNAALSAFPLEEVSWRCSFFHTHIHIHIWDFFIYIWECFFVIFQSCRVTSGDTWLKGLWCQYLHHSVQMSLATSTHTQCNSWHEEQSKVIKNE